MDFVKHYFQKKSLLNNSTKTVCLFLYILTINSVTAKEHKTSIMGYVAHGINTFNGKAIGNYEHASPNIPWLNIEPKIREIGVYQPGADDAGTITEFTDVNRLVATTRSFIDFFNPGGALDLELVNKPLNTIGSNYFGYTGISDRVVPDEFPPPGTGPIIHRAHHVVSSPTVKQWNNIKGLMTIEHQKNGTSRVKITIKDGFPNSIYTLWDVGANYPLSPDESGYAVPLGGLPNVLVTNPQGCGFISVDLSYQLNRPCQSGQQSCTSYVSAFYHWDGQVYGASPAATWANAPTGIYAGNQMVWPINGDLLQQPSTQFTASSHGCPLSSRKMLQH